MQNNSAARGGAINALQAAQLFIADSKLRYNAAVRATDGTAGAGALPPEIGGAILALGQVLLEIRTSNITGNFAMQGGGIQAEGTVTLRLGAGVHVTGNVAGGTGASDGGGSGGGFSGGGGFALSTPNFDPTAVVQAA